MKVKHIVEQIRLLPDTYIDSNFGQGRDAVLKQLEKFGGQAEAFVDKGIEESKLTIADLIKRSAPYVIPNDYIFFLEYYGGLAIVTEDAYFSIYGIGPMSEEDYSSIVSDYVIHEPGEMGFLSLAQLGFRNEKYKFQYGSFFIDIAGNVQKNAVIYVGPWGKGMLSPDDILVNIHAHPGKWQKIADSFIEWLEYVARTRGLFNF